METPRVFDVVLALQSKSFREDVFLSTRPTLDFDVSFLVGILSDPRVPRERGKEILRAASMGPGAFYRDAALLLPGEHFCSLWHIQALLAQQVRDSTSYLAADGRANVFLLSAHAAVMLCYSRYQFRISGWSGEGLYLNRDDRLFYPID